MPVGLAAAAGVLLTALELLSPAHLDAPGASAALETVIAMLAMASTALLARRFASTRSRHDQLLLVAVAGVAATDLAFATAPAMAGIDRAVAGIDARLVVQLLVALAFTAAALAPDRRVAGNMSKGLAITGLAGAAAAGGAELADSLLGVRPLIGALSHSQAAAAAHAPLALGAMVASSAALVVAGVAFLGRTQPRGRNTGALAVALFLLAAARLEFLTLPPAPAGWVTPADGLRLVAYAMLLLAALRGVLPARHDASDARRLELARAIQRATQVAASAERQRLARDLHDGLAQDLAIIALYAQGLRSELGGDHPLMVAARRALATSRGAILDLSGSSAPTTAMALRQVADELAARYGIDVTVTVQPADAGELTAAEREHVVRIAREAIANAASHGGARRVEVSFDPTRSTWLKITDDGSGLQDGEPRSDREPRSDGGFGLPAMRARARSLGGQLSARSGSNGGTEVELQVP